MKKILFLFCTILLSCGGNDSKKPDSNANNIVEEKSDTNSSNNSDAVSHFNVSEDMTIDNSVIIPLPSDKLTESIQAKLQSQGKSFGTVNSDGSVYMVGTASTGVPVNRSGFITSRNIAFAKAELRAKIQILKLSGEVVTSERNSSLIAKNVQGTDPDTAEKASFIEKVATLADKSIDKALSELGVSDSEISSLNQDQKEKRYSENFYNYVSSYVGSMIKGVSVIKIAEGEVGSNDYEVAVCVKYSPEQQSEAANIENLGASTETINSNVVNKIRTMPSEDLVSKLGAQFFKDENGNRFILGFGQASVQKSESRQSTFINIGRRKARLQAVENIKNLLSEDLVGKEISESVEKITEFQDGEQSLYTEDNFSELIQSKRSSIKMNTMNVKDWNGTHPVSNSMVVGAVVILTESNNINFTTKKSNAKKNTTTKSDYQVSKDIDGEEF
ncbi:hypothetical protein OAC93_04605 [Flavobacteriaceae bacterium]|nr:hypothetical protein [Flavobacteriaceae bacterium]MDB9787684.1 hypothetical protein [Flavobacteriaceae bacterium]MDB9902411.1 hypothetical protein [Flavobacteriaceae bacterium]